MVEFDALYQIDVNQSSEDATWANSRFITSYPDFMSATPNAANAGDMEPLSRRPQTHIGIFTVTHNGESLCNVQLTADPVIHGDVIQMVADFSDVQIPCEQVFPFSGRLRVDDRFTVLRGVFCVPAREDRPVGPGQHHFRNDASHPEVPLLLQYSRGVPADTADGAG